MSSGLRGLWQTLRTSARHALSRRAEPASDVPAAMRSPATGEFPRFGHYEIEAEIGRGAVGAVYRARDTDGRLVAIKTFAWAGDADDPAARDAHARFLAEAQTARRLRHPHIVELHEAGEVQGVSYIAMAYAPGRSLDACTSRETLLPAPLVLEIAACVADALAHAHRHGVLHRDIKPANVIVEAESRSVKVTDFGIAGLLDATRTRSGVMLGTPAFMAPEVLIGQRADARSDIYGLGVTLFQLLTGHLPHESASLAQLMRSIVNEPAPDVRQQRHDLPETVARVVAQALARRPEQRYADALTFAEDLRAAARVIPSPDENPRTYGGSPHRPGGGNGSEPRHNDSNN